jgi:peptide/nickel transport system substrate-binding protein/oligopeptide transport system substrate-binding protein
MASDTLIHLAGKVEGLDYSDRGTVQLKGLADSVRVWRVNAAPNEPVVKVLGVIHSLPGIIGIVLPFTRQQSPVLRRLSGFFIAILSIAIIVGAVFGVGRLFQPPARSLYPNEAKIQTLNVNLVWGIQGPNPQDINTFDPAYAIDGASGTVDSLIFPNLVTLDEHLRIELWAASSYSVSTDGKSYTFNLRSGLKWSDGSPIDALSFASALNRTLSPCTQSPFAHYLFGLRDAEAFHSQTCGSNGVISAAPGQTVISSLLNDPLRDSIVVADPLKLELYLGEAAPYFIDVLTDLFAAAVPVSALLSGDWVHSLLDHGSFGGNLFVLSQHGGGTVTLQRNPTFWGTKPQLRTIVFDVAGSGHVNGKVDDIDQCTSHEGAGCVKVPTLSTEYIGFNWSAPPLDDLRMRQALALALDKTQFEHPFDGTGTNHIVPDSVPSYSNRSLTGPQGTTSVTGDVAKAQQLAKEYATAKCGGKLSNCAPITLSYFPAGFATEADTAQSLWQQAFPGLQVNVAQGVNPYGPDHSRLQAWLSDWGADYPDPQDFLSLQFLPEDFNLTDTSADAGTGVYSLLRQADVELLPAARMHDYQEAEQTLVNQVAWIPLDHLTTTYVVWSYVANYHRTAMGAVSLDTWQKVYILQH